MVSWLFGTIFVLLALSLAAAMDVSTSEDMFFVSRPDLRAPRFNVTTYRPERLSDGYWFVAAYVDLGSRSESTKLCHTGPHIYDDHGDLVWSGACDVRNRNTFDFKPWEHDGIHGVSAVIEEQSGSLDMWHKRGAALIWNTSYAVVDSVDPQESVLRINFHEFTKLEGDNHTLMLYDGAAYRASEGMPDEMLVWDGGFAELDAEGQVIFKWRALDHVDIAESTE